MSETPRKKIPPIFLLRKSRGSEGADSVVLNKSDFPLRFTVDGKAYETLMTRKGGVVTRRI